MAALVPIDYAAGQDTMPEVYDKINAITSTVNGITFNNTLATKVVEIGDWNMDSTSSVSVAHGITLFNIRSVAFMILNDAGTALYPHGAGVPTRPDSVYVGFVDSTNVLLIRETSSTFDSTDFDATGYNRGWIIITYVA